MEFTNLQEKNMVERIACDRNIQHEFVYCEKINALKQYVDRYFSLYEKNSHHRQREIGTKRKIYIQIEQTLFNLFFV